MKEFLKRKKVLCSKENFTNRKEIEKTKLGGLLVTLKGRLKGIRRARKTVLYTGTVAPNTLDCQVYSHQKPIPTKWGIWNLKVHLSRTII